MPNTELGMGRIIFIKLASYKDIKTGCSNIKVKFGVFIYRPWEKDNILECIRPARICNISCISHLLDFRVSRPKFFIQLFSGSTLNYPCNC